MSSGEAEDIYADIRQHADRAGGKFLQENVVLAVVEEILASQELPRHAIHALNTARPALCANTARRNQRASPRSAIARRRPSTTGSLAR